MIVACATGDVSHIEALIAQGSEASYHSLTLALYSELLRSVENLIP